MEGYDKAPATAGEARLACSVRVQLRQRGRRRAGRARLPPRALAVPLPVREPLPQLREYLLSLLLLPSYWLHGVCHVGVDANVGLDFQKQKHHKRVVDLTPTLVRYLATFQIIGKQHYMRVYYLALI